MSRVEEIEIRIQQLSADELRDLRSWFAEYDAELWDRQIENDVRDGKLDRLAERALRGHEAGESSRL